MVAFKTQRSTSDRTSMRVTVTVHELGTTLPTMCVHWMFPSISRSVEEWRRAACRPREMSDQPFELVASPVSGMLRYLPVEPHRLDWQFRGDMAHSLSPSPDALPPRRSLIANAAGMLLTDSLCSLATFDSTPKIVGTSHLAPGPAGHRRRRAARRRQGCPLRAAHPRGCGGTSGRPITVRRCPAVVGADAPDG
jgi:hypothetical protein